MELLLLLVVLLVFLLAVGLIVPLNLAMYRGAPYLPSRNDAVAKMLAMANLKPGQKAADLGSGDGRILIALAKQGVIADGYEINPWLVWWSRLMIRRSGTQDKAHAFCQSFWKQDFSQYDALVLYVLPATMIKLQHKLKKDLKPGTKLVANTFVFPDWEPVAQDGKIRVYEIPKRS